MILLLLIFFTDDCCFFGLFGCFVVFCLVLGFCGTMVILVLGLIARGLLGCLGCVCYLWNLLFGKLVFSCWLFCV